MSKMGTPENGFRKTQQQEPKRHEMTIREAVTKYGDEWRLMFPDHRFIREEHMECETRDTWEALHMRQMERGERSRIRVEDIRDDE